MPSVRVIGGGRAGGSVHGALVAAGWTSGGVLGRHDDLSAAAHGVDLLVLATPDGSLAEVAASVVPVASTVVAHLSGATGLDVLADHPSRASVHPLVSLPDPETGAQRLQGAWFALAGRSPAGQSPAGQSSALDLVRRLVDDLGGRAVTVADDDRATYHAAAVVASNHLVALLGQVERLAASVGVPLEAFLDLAAGSLDNVQAVGPAAALTGPAARGDEATIAAHLAALPPDERATYEALVVEARRLAGQRAP